MSRARWILSNLNVLNIVLAAVLIVFANNMFLPLFGKGAKLTVPSPQKKAAVPAKTTEKPVESKSPSPSDYFIIAEQNIFHPERKIPVEKKDVVVQPLPKPEFVLYGTLLTDDVRIAYMEDRKAPQNSPSRGKKQIPLRLGEALSGFTLKEISANSVVMVRGNESVTIDLNDAAKDKTREQMTGAVAGQPGVPPQPSQPFGRKLTPPHQPAGTPSSPPAATAARPSGTASTTQQSAPTPVQPAPVQAPSAFEEPARQPGRGGGLYDVFRRR